MRLITSLPHALAVGPEHRDGAHVVQHVFRGDGLRPHPRLSEGDIFRHLRIQVMTHHDHVEVLVEGVDGVGVGRVGRGRQAVQVPAAGDDVRGVAAAGAFGVIHVNSAAVDRGERIFQEAGLVQRVGVQLHLKVQLVGHREAGVDHRRHRTPVLVNLQPQRAASELVNQRARLGGVAAPEKPEVDRPLLRGLKHLADVPGAAAVDADGNRPERAADHGGYTGADRVLAQLRRVEVHMHVDAAGRGDQAFGVAHGGGRAADQLRMHAVHHRRVAGLADCDDTSILDSDIALHHAQHRVDDHRVGDEHVERALGAIVAGGQPQPVAQRLAAAVQALVARHGVVVLDLGDQGGVAQPQRIALGRAIERRVLLA